MPPVQASDTPVTALLARFPLFACLQEEALARMAHGVREVHVARGHIIFHRGDVPAGFYLVVRGQVKLAVGSPQGSEKITELLTEGQAFGLALMLLEKPYMVYAQALKESCLLFVSKSVINQELECNPRFSRRVISMLSHRLYSLISDLETLSLHNARQRVIGYLLGLQPETGMTPPDTPQTIDLQISKGVIASSLNLTQEHFSRILRDLADSGLIAVVGRKITLMDVAGLRASGI